VFFSATKFCCAFGNGWSTLSAKLLLLPKLFGYSPTSENFGGKNVESLIFIVNISRMKQDINLRKMALQTAIPPATTTTSTKSAATITTYCSVFCRSWAGVCGLPSSYSSYAWCSCLGCTVLCLPIHCGRRQPGRNNSLSLHFPSITNIFQLLKTVRKDDVMISVL